MVVFAFDRDWTVDVNPHPRHEAVPLRWVRHLAHETDHPVYAIGNQDLAEEAAIPGVVDVVGRHPDDWDDWLGGKQSDGRYEQFPLRRERLALIADLHPEADSYVVVDDLDLSDVSGWDHYHAWDFVPAVERGEIDPDLPWVREPRADGGYPTTAGIVPPDPQSLSSFLDEHDDPPGYELTYADGDGEQTDLLWRVTVNERTVDRPSAAPTIRCVPLDPGEESFQVRVDAVELLSVVDPPPELYTAGADTPSEEATGLRRLAATDPTAVRVSAVLSLLDRTDERPRRDALRALASVATVRPSDCTPALPILESLFEDGLSKPAPALATVRAIATECPADVAPLVDAIVPSLDAEDETARVEAARCVMEVADVDTADAIDAVPALATIVEDGGAAQGYAVYALTSLSREYPEEVKPVTGQLASAITDDSISDNVRLNATAALGRVVGEYPSVAVNIVDDVVALFDAENHKLRNNAVGLVADVATVHTDVVEPHVDAIVALFPTDDDYTRINASGCLSRVAEDFPETVAEHTDLFVELLTDDHPLARENACWALGHLSAEEAEMALVERASQDDEADVRERAEWALRRIQG